MAAVTNQPTTLAMTPQLPSSIPGVPPGLEYLMSVDQLLIKQKIEAMEVFTGCEMRNRYVVSNSMKQQVFYCWEESETCHRILCGPGRGFIFHVEDNNHREVLTMERPFKCCAGCPCCADGCSKYPVYIKDGQGQQLGIMRMTNFYCAPRFGIFDNQESQLYGITGPCCPCQCCCGCTADIDYPVTSMKDGAKVANIAKQWAGVFREMVSDADSYNVSFPMDMHIMHKALIFASVFLVDMTLNENQNN